MGFYGNKILEAQEIINERTVYKDKQISIGMFGSTNRNYGDQAYFKIANNPNYDKATKVARINFSNASYEKHNDSGKENWKMVSNDKDKLIEVLNSKPNNGKYKNNPNFPTVWDALKAEFEETTNKKLDVVDMPDYSKL